MNLKPLKTTAIMTAAITLHRLPDRWSLPINGARITQFLVDRALAIRFQHEAERTILRIENDFYFQTGGGVHQPISLSHKGEVGNILILYGQSVTDFAIRDSGRLEVSLGEYRLVVDPHETVQAWQVVAESGLHVTCEPQGQLLIRRDTP
ncbi:hypothetical protein G4Y79_03720 [Phototrophicus methaneseepsis]|uniref:Uncharacterized protein n=1 Tax=Phototrophicus methaneseepsis TaxID=2710758 RepID=A0A7S8IFE5_9CHLR|nr:DUF6188 family protein [Phototrophicus methaneseepsis]QPC83502.1 hypothetical protein G4Y79_03720 [Phototrophicus methaneseepsis]